MSSDMGSEMSVDPEFKWLKEICASVTHTDPEGTSIGYCTAKLIQREEICGNFYNEMEEPSMDTSLLAFALFDRYGRLRPEFKSHPYRQGSGVWNDEIDEGVVFLIEEVFIEEDYRRQGLGKKVMAALLEKAKGKIEGYFFAFVRPDNLTKVEDQEKRFQGKSDQELESLLQQDRQTAISFYRSLGFRRIGSSDWFGLASDPNHLSHSLPAIRDFDPTPPQHPPLDERLHGALEADMEDADLLAALEKLLETCPDTDPGWLGTDDRGNTVLHTAAIGGKPKTLDWMLTKPFGTKMQTFRNDNGNTPLDALLFRLEETRTHRGDAFFKVEHVSDSFEGYSSASVDCLARLKGMVGPSRPEPSPSDRSLLIFGCTCGQCLGGILSPRTLLILEAAAATYYEVLVDDEFLLQEDPSWAKRFAEYLTHLPNAVRENLKTDKSMREGFGNLFIHIANCLSFNQLPTAENVLGRLREAGEEPPRTRNFLLRGGTVASAANAVFGHTIRYPLDDLGIFDEEFAAHPKCRNDNEFGFVAGMCGYKRVS